MRLSTVGGLVFGVLGLAVAIGVEARGAPEAEAEMIKAAERLDVDFVAAFNKPAADAIMALYWNSPDLVFFPPDTMEVRGWEAMKAAFAQMGKGATLETHSRKNRVAGDAVLGSGRWTLTMPGPDGKPMTLEGRYTDVKEKKDGKWVYTSDHASAPLAPPPAK
jgi:ketosteroid isomerase-like protein